MSWRLALFISAGSVRRASYSFSARRINSVFDWEGFVFTNIIIVVDEKVCYIRFYSFSFFICGELFLRRFKRAQ